MHFASGQVLRKGGRHLGAASVLNADEQQLRNGLDQPPISLRSSGEPLLGESGNQYRQEVRDSRRRL
jgi:hypothetical protein